MKTQIQTLVTSLAAAIDQLPAEIQQLQQRIITLNASIDAAQGQQNY